MKLNLTQYIYIILFICAFNNGFSQKLVLKIASKDKKEYKILSKIDFIKNHFDSIAVYNEINNISEKLKKTGYLSNTINNITKKDSIFTCLFSLGKKTEKAIINIPITFKNLIKEEKITIPINELPLFLKTISNRLGEQGRAFSEVRLKDIRLDKKTLFANLDIKTSKKRTIDRIIVKGYENFSTAYLTYFFKLKKGNTFNHQTLKNISTAVKSLQFVSEIKPPETLFLKDSTILYVYLKKNKASSFDGLLNFSSNKDKKDIVFNGHINLELNDVLHTGEQFKLLWKANGEERQDFNITTKIPYLFNTPFSPELSFNLYKQDSTFLNTKFYGGIKYTINHKASTVLTYNTTFSKNTLQNPSNMDINDFDNYFLGLKMTYKIPDNRQFFEDRFYIDIHPAFGKRTSNNTKENQFKLNLKIAYLWHLNYRNAVFLKNETGYFNSDTFLENEIYRIGGTNSIRGFNEQGIFTPQFSYATIEYRYLTSHNSYIYSITDFGQARVNNIKEQLTGLGLGYLFKIKNTQIKIEYLLGKSSTTDFKLKNSRIGVQFVNYF